MRTQLLWLSLSAALTATGCQQIECADGTIERDGKCEPPDNGQVSPASCGPFTELVGDQCVPMFPPTECDPATTEAVVDDMGVVTCRGIGVAGCDAPIPCAKPSGAKQTICGQLYDFRDMTKLQGTMPKGTPCDPANPATSGPCALSITPYNAVEFASGTPTMPLNNNGILIDDCGRFKITEVDTNAAGPFIGLGIDDANMTLGPNGTTVTVAVAVPTVAATATQNLEGFIVPAATAAGWMSMGGPNFGATGLFIPIFRQHKTGNGDPFAPQMGVTVTKGGNTVPNNDTYFDPATLGHMTISTTATATGANGTALVNSASVGDGPMWGGNGGLGAGCRWEPHAGATLPGVLFIQVFKKLDLTGMTCAD